MTVEQFLAARPPIQGDAVYDERDPRHVGTLEAVRPTGAVVRWHATGWYSEGVPLRRLRRHQEEGR